MQKPNGITSWLVLGPIYNEEHQAGSHSSIDTHPSAIEIIKDIDNDALDPRELTRSLAKSPEAGDTAAYGNGKIFPNKTYAWRIMEFSNVNWENIHDIEDDIHKALAIETGDSDQNHQGFAGKHHALAFFLVYIHSPDARTTNLCVMSDDTIRVWLNGAELEEPLRCTRERDITEDTPASCGGISLLEGNNILLAAVAETHVEWGFYAGIENDQGLIITPMKPVPPSPVKPVKVMERSDSLDYPSFLGTGWSFPPEFILDTGKVVMTADEADIEASLRILFGTAMGERFMNPKYGLDMHDMLFEPMGTTLKTLLQDQVKMAILIYEPRIKLLTLDLDTSGHYEGNLSILVEYEVRSTNSRYNLVYPFNTAGGGNA
jgi:phage baseplate assembly protein W